MSNALAWFVLGLVFLGIDLCAPHLVLLFFGVGAMGASIATVFGFDLTTQLVCFLVLSVASLFLFRKKLRVIFQGRSREGLASEEHDHPLVGRSGKVTRALSDHLYEIEIDGSFWRVISRTPLALQSLVTVVGVEKGDALLLRVIPFDVTGKSVQTVHEEA
ncbi:MAG: NfeD family protein [Desulfovibrio sp.]|nr:NfeD family protein [Desulfovibrio sp.]